MSKVSCQVCGDYTNNEPAICGDCLAEGATHVNEPRIFDSSPLATEPVSLSATPELTAQDLGKPSLVPYSVFINSPAVMTEETGIERLSLSLAVSDLSSCNVNGKIPVEAQPFVEMARKAFRAGYYRFELVVGDLSIRIYKHPNNP
jgi:hypothetical protein